MAQDCILWGSELSPFALKLRALLEYAGIAYRWLPADGTRFENYRASWRIESAKRAGAIERYPQLSPLDEYPLVPYLIEAGGRVLYDSSALAHWIDDRHPPCGGRLFPEDPLPGFLAHLLDEAFDEFGLYMVHHNRWVLSAAGNDAGERLAHEFRRVLLPGMGAGFGRRFARRQVRRLPYLFSVAAAGFSIPGLPAALTPPSRGGFPPTQQLLDGAWEAHLAAMETVLTQQPYLLGGRFSVADASAYGQLSMNLKDKTAAERLRQLAPTTFDWLCRIRNGEHANHRGALAPAECLKPLLQVVLQTFVPLMQQNEAAYHDAQRRGETLFNEPAFNRGRALYDGTLMGKPFRAVVKTFQVRVWRELRQSWRQLPGAVRRQVSALADADMETRLRTPLELG